MQWIADRSSRRNNRSVVQTAVLFICLIGATSYRAAEAREVSVYRSVDGGYHFSGSRDDAVGPAEWKAWQRYWQEHRAPGEPQGAAIPPPPPGADRRRAGIPAPSRMDGTSNARTPATRHTSPPAAPVLPTTETARAVSTPQLEAPARPRDSASLDNGHIPHQHVAEQQRDHIGDRGKLEVDVPGVGRWSPTTPMREIPVPTSISAEHEEADLSGFITLVLFLGSGALLLWTLSRSAESPAEQHKGRTMSERARRARQQIRTVHAVAEQNRESRILPAVISRRPSLPSTPSAAWRKVTTEDLASVARTGNLDPLLEAVAAERLRELNAGRKARPRTLADIIFGVPGDATTRTRDALRDMTDTINDATAMLEARGRFTAAGIQLATAQKRATLEDAQLDTELAQQDALKVRHETAANSAALEDAKLDTAITAQGVLKTLYTARAALEDAKLATAIAEQAALKAEHDATARRAETRDDVRAMARRFRKDLSREVRAARHDARRHMRELRTSAQNRVARAKVEVRNLRAQMRTLEADQDSRSAVQQAEVRGRASVQATIDQLRIELEGARRRLAAHDDELTKAKRTLELERIKADTQRAQHDQQVATAFLERRMQDALDPDAARHRTAELQHRRELQQIADKLQSFTNDAERVAYAKRESDAYVQQAADEYGENSDEHDAAISRAEEFMHGLLDREQI